MTPTALADAPTGTQLHPLNRQFTWQDAPGEGRRRLTAQQISDFNERGFFRLENAFMPEELAAVIEAIDPLEAAREEEIRSQGASFHLSSIDAITFTTHIAGRSPVLKAFAAHPVLKDVCHDLIGDEVRLYWDQSVYKKSGKPQEFPWHQDNGYTFIEPQQYVTCWIPLVDVDEENGCPWIAPGLHRLGTFSHWPTPIGLKCLEDAPDAVSAPARAGDIIVFSSLAPHRTGPNLKAGSIRKAYILQYAPDGAMAHVAGGPAMPQDDPDRQFKVLENGR